MSQIPVVTPETIDEIPNNTLVRCLGMVQDMFNPEYFVSEYKDAEGVWQTTRYGDCTDDHDSLGSGCGSQETEKRFDERHPLLVVPVPGMSSWVEERLGEEAKASIANVFGRSMKKGLVQDDRGGTKRRWQVEGAGLEVDSSGPASDADYCRTLDRETKKAAGMNSDVGGRVSSPDPGKSRGGSSVNIPRGSCVVHLYNDGAKEDEKIKLNDVVEILGVISRVPELASSGMMVDEGDDEDTLASRVPTSIAPRIHAISVKKVNVSSLAYEMPQGTILQSRTACASIRHGIINFLTRTLFGDELAAEYVLMQLVSRVHRRTNNDQGIQTHLGTAALNLTGFDSCSQGRLSEDLGAALSLLMPSVRSLPLNIEFLNQKPWYPTKIQNSCQYGAVLQLPAGSVLLLDETAMSAGQLTETGLKNLGAIQTMMQSQKLPYDFQFYQLDQPTDQPIIITSVGRTMLKGVGEIQVILNRRDNGSCMDVLDEGSFDKEIGGVKAARQYLAFAKSMEFRIPSELEKVIENDMTEARKRDAANVNAETFHTWLNIARLQCLSHCESELTLDRWRQVLRMEDQRLGRMQHSK
jgi:hypothetical protein